jgi:hypothetical protein
VRPNLNDLYWRGARQILLGQLQAEWEKRGYLRGGNTGLLDEGVFTGKCPRLTFLRQQALLTEFPNLSRELMFESGHFSEDAWTAVLLAAQQESLVVKREAEIPIRWETANGTAVSGRPDTVLVQDGANVLGVEYKLVCSLWTAKSVLCGQPKPMHIMQAGHYSWQLQMLNWDLWYTSRVDWAVPEDEWMESKFPKQGTPGGACMEFKTTKRRKDGKNHKAGDTTVVPKKILPFRQGFFLRWNDKEELEYAPHNDMSVGFVASIVTPTRIRDYYEFVSTMQEDKKLGGRPVNMDCVGSAGGYDICSYCEMQKICGATEKDGFTAFVAAAQERHVIILQHLRKEFGIIFNDEEGYKLET